MKNDKSNRKGKRKMRSKRARIDGARRARRTDLVLMNFKISAEDRQLFLDKAAKGTNGNVSALIIKSVKLAPIQKLRRYY